MWRLFRLGKGEAVPDKDYFKKYKSVPSVLQFGRRKEGKIDVSICIPTFNRPDLLEECIYSCLNQKPSSLSVEIIVVDNNPEADNDNLNLLRRIDKQEVCYYQNGSNLGMCGNWNRCIELARGKWVSLLHDDDLLAPDCFCLWKKLLASSKFSPKIAYVKTAVIKFTEASDIARQDGIKNKIRKKYGIRFYLVKGFDLIAGGNPGTYGIPSCGMLMRRDAALEIGGYNTEYFCPSDDAFLPVRLFNHGYGVVATIAPFGYYRCAVNASMKRETHIAWVRDMVSYRQQPKRQGGIYERYGRYFEDAQLYFFCQWILREYVPPHDCEGYFDEIEEVCGIKIKKMRFMFYKMIRRIHDYTFYIRALF